MRLWLGCKVVVYDVQDIQEEREGYLMRYGNGYIGVVYDVEWVGKDLCI